MDVVQPRNGHQGPVWGRGPRLSFLESCSPFLASKLLGLPAIRSLSGTAQPLPVQISLDFTSPFLDWGSLTSPLFFVFAELRAEPRALGMLGRYPSSDLYPCHRLAGHFVSLRPV